MKSYISEILGASGNPSPKSELFAYRYYDKTHDLYINTHKTMGFVLEIKPIVGVRENTIEQLSLLLDEYLPANRVGRAITNPTLSHHRTSDVAYGGFVVMFTKFQ